MDSSGRNRRGRSRRIEPVIAEFAGRQLYDVKHLAADNHPAAIFKPAPRILKFHDINYQASDHQPACDNIQSDHGHKHADTSDDKS